MGRGEQTATWGGDGEEDWRRLGRVQEHQRQVILFYQIKNQTDIIDLSDQHLSTVIVKLAGCSTSTEARTRRVGNLLEESRTDELLMFLARRMRLGLMGQRLFPKDTQNTRTSSQELHILL